jgi:acyl-CoA dehydrogenase
VADNGMEQFVRDVRITQIYEGANGVQAADLIGRKIVWNDGRALASFIAEVESDLKSQESVEGMAKYVKPVRESLGHLVAATQWINKNRKENPENAGAASYDYMHLFGLVAMGYMWCRMVQAARAKLAAAGAASDPYLNAKLVTGRFFVERLLPETAVRLARIKAGADSTMALPAEAF